MLLTGEQVSADQALAWGLATQVVEDGDELKSAIALGEQLSALSTSGQRAIKAALDLGDLSIEDALVADVEIAVAHMKSRDAALGFETFKTRATLAFEDH
jgi:enoyl-CoA hydratase/carnithine racemase